MFAPAVTILNAMPQNVYGVLRQRRFISRAFLEKAIIANLATVY